MIYTAKLNQLNVTSIVRKLQAAESVILTTHRQCDGDGLGAMLSLHHALKKIGKNVRTLTVDAVPRKYQFLDPQKHLEVFEGPHKAIEATDLALVFDTNDHRMVEPLFQSLNQHCREILFVDHHPVLTAGPEPTLGSLIETRAASTGEIAYFMIKELGIHFDEKLARALYTSIAFDTQLFKFVRSSGNSHLIAAELLNFVTNADEIHQMLFSTHTRGKIAFLAKAFGDIEYFANGRIAVLKLYAKDLLDHDLEMDDSRDVIDMVMNINSLEAAALFREDAPNEYKLSLRSKGRIEVLGVAEAVNGGGHLYAAGASVRGPFSELKAKVVDLLINRLDDNLPQSEPEREGKVKKRP